VYLIFSEGIMTESTKENRKVKPRIILSLLVFLLYTPLILFISSGRLDWWMGWIYSILAVVLSISSRILMARKHPDLVEERASYREAEGAKEWDKKLVPWVAQIGPLITLIVAGLDKRFGWSPILPMWVPWVALGIAILGFLFSTWALVENRYFSSIVRIQNDRGHTVCDTGPYQYVRHPGYAGGLVWYLMTPMILSTLWAYIPTLMVVGLTVLRTSLEDQTLQAELAGYQEYTQRTRYRLVPGIW
jgi:protein-S-isoprenylcysteine O-methyltransferase Ste14